ncbi:chromosomal replication initiator protein DnaA [Halorhodospira halochloris]|uniref:Chromosomal replication initiator protein DnaA n=1 Tax=Halorhodospira halochloris TaxID=1052 RepID=A0A110B1F2_HALHR|nr:DnaA regulatory inactivator Hda [Halorhodospira halochloris]MBK1651573.1 DnaA regulatory inactivator Hda [Halorhodospira halochloris]BAU57160.1 chromosomal replication initiator protein DnaA [Halorhodospira halochloris]
MAVQLPLDIKWNESASLERFIAGANAESANWVAAAAEGRNQGPALFLHGPPATGKSHLLQGACKRAAANGTPAAYLPLSQLGGYGAALFEGFEQAGLVAVDDVDVLEVDDGMQHGLFHFFNRAVESGCSLLFAARQPPSQLTLQLADLRSRLSWGVVIALQQPDEQTCLLILRQRASIRGLDLPPATARYLIRRLPRSIAILLDVFDDLDRASLAQGRRLTVPFVRGYLNQQGLLGESAPGTAS